MATSLQQQGMKNPFTPMFGAIPQVLAGRDAILSETRDALRNGSGDPHRIVAFSGSEGSGKTTLLSLLSQEAEGMGWVAVDVSCSSRMLNEISAIVATHDVGASMIGAFGQTDLWRLPMQQCLSVLGQDGLGMLITVDDVNAHTAELFELLDLAAHAVRKGLPLCLFLAGVPEVYQELAKASKCLLSGMLVRQLDGLTTDDAERFYKQIVEANGRSIGANALQLAAASCGGHALMMQLIGFNMWRQNPEFPRISREDVLSAVAQSSEDMAHMVFGQVLKSLSEKDKDFLIAMAQDAQCSSMNDVAQRLGVTTSYARIYKKRLSDQGLIYSPKRGLVEFTLPGLRHYLRTGN